MIDQQSAQGMIAHFEGCELNAYPDPLSGGDPWTIGYGHTGPEVHQGLVWTQDQADNQLATDISTVESQLDVRAPWWRSLDDIRCEAVVCMAYQLGVSGFLAFHNMIAALQAHNWDSAADNALDSTWARQTPTRAKCVADQIRTGERSW